MSQLWFSQEKVTNFKVTKRQKQILQTLIFFLVGIGLVYFQIKGLSASEKEQIVSSVKQANIFLILGAMVVSVLSHFIRAVRWKQLIKSATENVSTTNSFYAVMIGYLANGFLPRFGEVIRCGVLGRKENIKIEKLIGTVVVERLFDLIIMLIVVALTILVQYEFLFQFLNKNLFQPAIHTFQNNSGKIILILVALVVGSVVAYFALNQFLSKVSSKLADKWESIKHNFTDGFTAILKLDNKPLFVLYSLLMWCCYFLMSFLVIKSLPQSVHLDFQAGLSVLTSGSLALIIPTPGGLGSYHQFVSKTLQLYDLSQATGVALSWLIWSTNFAIILVFGLLSLLLISTSRNKKIEN